MSGVSKDFHMASRMPKCMSCALSSTHLYAAHKPVWRMISCSGVAVEFVDGYFIACASTNTTRLKANACSIGLRNNASACGANGLFKSASCWRRYSRSMSACTCTRGIVTSSLKLLSIKCRAKRNDLYTAAASMPAARLLGGMLSRSTGSVWCKNSFAAVVAE